MVTWSLWGLEWHRTSQWEQVVETPPQTPRMQEREELRAQHPFQSPFETVTRSLVKAAWGREICFCLTLKTAVRHGEDSPGQE